MLDRIKALLWEDGKSINSLTVVNEGASGAHILNADNTFIIKYAVLYELDAAKSAQFQREYDFYRRCTDEKIDFIPEVVYQFANDNEILIALEKYTTIRSDEWDNDLQKRAMRLCARINAADITDDEALLHIDKENDTYSLSDSYQNWCRLQEKFPLHINASMLTEMYENHNEVELYAESLVIPKTLCHGDFHPNNFLIHHNKLIICDWQNVNIGRGIDDVAFFMSRGSDMGLQMNRDMLIREYCEAFHQHTNERIELADLYKQIATSEFSVSFKFWADYLQNSSIERVMGIYNSMVNSYQFVLS